MYVYINIYIYTCMHTYSAMYMYAQLSATPKPRGPLPRAKP